MKAYAEADLKALANLYSAGTVYEHSECDQQRGIDAIAGIAAAL